jgi:hypothetical protein
MPAPMEVTTLEKELQQRYYNLVFIGLLYLKIALNLLNLVMHAKE